MTSPFILMTLACVVMAIVICLQWRCIKRQEKLISDFYEKDFREVMDYGKVNRREYRDINIENADDNIVADMIRRGVYQRGDMFKALMRHYNNN